MDFLNLIIVAAASLPLASSPLAPPVGCIRDVDRLVGSQVSGLALAGATAVIGAGPNLVFVDLSDPAAPVAVAEVRRGAQSAVPYDHETVTPLGARDGYVLVSVGSIFEMYDVSDPASPELAGTLDLGFEAERAAVVGDRAWLAGTRWQWNHSEPAVAVVDLTDPTDPREIGGFVPAAPVSDLVVTGDLVALAEGNDQLQLLDGSDPARPRVLSTTSLGGPIWRLTVVGTLAYAMTSGGIQVLDIADPATVSVVRSIPYSAPGILPAAIIAAGDRLFLGHGESWQSDLYPVGGFQVFDLADPEAPVLVGSAVFSNGGYELLPMGDHLLVADADHGLRVFDVGVAGGPVEVGCVNRTRNDVYAVGVDGNLAFVGDQGLRVVDVDPSREPAEIGAVELEGTVTSVAVSPGPLVAMVYWEVDGPGSWRDRLLIIDRSDPRQPRARGRVDLPETSERGSCRLALDGNVVAVAAGEAGLLLIGLDDPDHPITLAEAPTSLPAVDVVLTEGLVVVATGTEPSPQTGRLEIYDVSDPTAPALVGAVAFPALPHAIAAAAGKVLIAFSDGVRTIDLRDPSAPLELGVADLPLGRVTGATIEGEHAYLSITPGSLVVLDLKDWEWPRLVERATWMPFNITDGDPMGGWDVAGHNGRPVVADGGFGLRILDTSRCLRRVQVPAGSVATTE